MQSKCNLTCRLFCCFCVLITFFILTSCDRNDATKIEYDAVWAIPISNSVFGAEDILNKFFNSKIYYTEDSTKFMSLNYATSEKNISFLEMQKKFFNFDTSINLKRTKQFPNIPGTGSYKFYYRDTITFVTSDFIKGHNIHIDSLSFLSGEFIYDFDSQLPDGWFWSCKVFSQNLTKNGNYLSVLLDMNDVHKNFDATNFKFLPSNDSLYFVCDFTLTVVGPCQQGSIIFDMNLGFNDIYIESIYGDFPGLNYTTESFSMLNFFTNTMGDIDMHFFNAFIKIPFVNYFGTKFRCTFDYLTMSNDAGEVKELLKQGTYFDIDAPMTVGDSIADNCIIPINGDVFTIKPNKINYKILFTSLDDDCQNFITVYNGMNIKLILDIPLQFDVNELEYIDTIHFAGFNLEKEKSIDNYIRSCNLLADFNNAFPIGFDALLILTDSNYVVLDTVFNGLVSVKPSNLDDEGKTISPVISKFEWNMNNEQIKKMNKTCNVLINMKFNKSADYESVKIYSNDFLGLRLKSLITFNDIEIDD